MGWSKWRESFLAQAQWNGFDDIRVLLSSPTLLSKENQGKLSSLVDECLSPKLITNEWFASSANGHVITCRHTERLRRT